MAASSRPPAAARLPAGPRSTAANRAPNAPCRSRRPGSRSTASSPARTATTPLLLRPTLDKLARLPDRDDRAQWPVDEGMGIGLPDDITVHLDAGYDSGKTRDLLAEYGCQGVISAKGFPLQAGKRWVIERTNSWHNRGFKKLAICTERRTHVIEAFIALANAVIITRRLLAEARLTHRWDTRPDRRP